MSFFWLFSSQNNSFSEIDFNLTDTYLPDTAVISNESAGFTTEEQGIYINHDKFIKNGFM